MSGLHNERNIRAKIQEFERQLNTDEISIPTPRPRNTTRPVIAPKPSATPQGASFSSTTEEETNTQDYTGNIYDRFISSDSSPVPPSPALKPQMPRKPSLNSIDQFKPLIKPPPQLPSRPSLRSSRPLNSQGKDAAFNTPAFNTSAFNASASNTSTDNTPAFNTSAFNASASNTSTDNTTAFNTSALNASALNTSALNASAFTSSALNTTPLSPRSSYNNQQNSSNHSSTRENEYVDAPVSHALSNLSRGASITNAVSRKPTIIRVPSKQEQEASNSFPPALPVQRGIGGPPASNRWQDSFSSACGPVQPPRPGGGKMPPNRPPPAKPAPGRPPPPRRDSILRNSTIQPQNKLRRNLSKKAPVLPPRPNPGHCLYNKYTLEIPHGIAEYDYNGMNTGELSFQKNEVLVLLNQTDNQTFECQVGDAKGTVQKSYMKIITPLYSYSYHDAYPVPQENTSRQAFSNSAENGTLQVQALYDFTPEGPGELSLKTGDIVNNVEQIDGEWYLGTSRGVTGFFPINYVKVLPRQPAAAPTPTPAPTRAAPQKVSGPRCVARFDFEGEHSDELSFTEGQVIGLLEYMGEDWARGKIGSHVGIFPLNFVEVMEDLPPSPAKNQTRVPLPGMASSNHMQPAASTHNQTRGVEQVKALYDFTAETDSDLSFLRGDVIEVTEHIDEEWSHGRLNGREGLFPISFTQTHTGGFSQR